MLRLVSFVRVVWLLRQGSVALVTVVCSGSAPVVAVRWPGCRGRWVGPRCSVFSSPFLGEGAAGVAGGEGAVVLLWCLVLLGWWGPLVDVDDAPGVFDAVGVMVCGVAVSTLGWGPGGWRWWRLFASRAGVLGVAVDWGALGVTLCRGRAWWWL